MSDENSVMKKNKPNKALAFTGQKFNVSFEKAFETFHDQLKHHVS